VGTWVSGMLRSFNRWFGENVVISVDVHPVWCSVISKFAERTRPLVMSHKVIV